MNGRPNPDSRPSYPPFIPPGELAILSPQGLEQEAGHELEGRGIPARSRLRVEAIPRVASEFLNESSLSSASALEAARA